MIVIIVIVVVVVAARVDKDIVLRAATRRGPVRDSIPVWRTSLQEKQHTTKYVVARVTVCVCVSQGGGGGTEEGMRAKKKKHSFSCFCTGGQTARRDGASRGGNTWLGGRGGERIRAIGGAVGMATLITSRVGPAMPCGRARLAFVFLYSVERESSSQELDSAQNSRQGSPCAKTSQTTGERLGTHYVRALFLSSFLLVCGCHRRRRRRRKNSKLAAKHSTVVFASNGVGGDQRPTDPS